MSSFNGADYDHLFNLGRRLYNSNSTRTRHEIATTLMAMAESVRGQMVPWPCIHINHRHLTTYLSPNTTTQQYLAGKFDQFKLRSVK